MTTYYRGPHAFMTADRFVWLLDTPKIFAVRELRDIRRVEVEQVPQGHRADVVLMAAAGSIAFAAVSWMVVGPVIAAVAVVVSIIAATVAVSSRRYRELRSYRVVATVRRVRTVIFETRDKQEFDQVARALSRVVDVDRRSLAHSGPVAA